MRKGNWCAWGSVGLALAMVGFVFPWTNRMDAQKIGGASFGEWRVAEPVRYENLSVFPIVSRQSADTTSFVTLDDALQSGDVVISEGGTDMIRRSRDGRPIAIPSSAGPPSISSC